MNAFLLIAKISTLDMKNMSEEEKRAYRRKLSIEELIITESEYIQDLKVLVRVRTFSVCMCNVCASLTFSSLPHSH